MIYLTVIAGLEAAVIAGLVVALLLHSKGCAELVANLDERHALTIDRMKAAIQRPDLVQPPTPVTRRSPEQIEKDRERARQMASVGTIAHARAE